MTIACAGTWPSSRRHSTSCCPKDLGQRYEFRGTDELSLAGALEQLGRLNRLDRLAAEMGDIGSPQELDQIDADELRRAARSRLGRRSAPAPGAGQAARGGGLRRAQRRAAQPDAARRATAWPGRARRAVRPHETRRVRRSRSPIVGHARRARRRDLAYEFGRPFDLHLTRTLANGLARGGLPGRAAGAHPARSARLRGIRERGLCPRGDRAAGRHEPLDAAARLLPGCQEGRPRARHADPDALSRTTSCTSWALPTTRGRSRRAR